MKKGKAQAGSGCESPLLIGHLRLMILAAEMGAHILPPVPSFYYRPKIMFRLTFDTSFSGWRQTTARLLEATMSYAVSDKLLTECSLWLKAYRFE